ncbi:DUF6316 family protein [Pseudomonas sp. GCM10022188]|uniref:DUF6316 family protein n=1 Tax=Pseudomonas TaxID=286 RepID=UPI001E62B3AC|nr:DUF6316 family protein [Pseudomonas oryzagri]MCC6076203.1 DUF6316 family protein [Pseudomonas oryzagri]
MFVKRQNDSAPATHYRSDRINTVDGQYFFATREGTLEGPFFTRFDAQEAANRYVDNLMSLAQPALGNPVQPQRSY